MVKKRITSTFTQGGNVYKGNLHAHSTLSDGRLEPEEVLRRYKEAGYHFASISDHDRYFNTTEYDSDQFIVIPAIEWTVLGPDNIHKGHHVHGIWGTREMAEAAGDRMFQHLQKLPPRDWEDEGSEHAAVQKCSDDLRSAGNLVIYNHPVWSKLEVADMMIEGLTGIEIYNYGCEIETANGNATLLWDQLLRRSRKVFGFASDDAHFGFESDSLYYGAFGGWIHVIANELTREALAEAIVQGSFYSSSGPEIYEYKVEGDEVVVRCSPVDRIHFISYDRFGRTFQTKPDETISEARYKLRGIEIFIRVECVDKRGRTAWTNPIYVKDELMGG